MKKILFLLFWFPLIVSAQLRDNFSDGDFLTNPTWGGQTEFFRVSNGLLQSQGPASTAKIYLSTASQQINETEWRFLVDLQFEPSGSNQVRVYLSSDQADLLQPLNGYFIEIGQSGADVIKLVKQTGTTNTPLITSSGSFTGNVRVNIRVRRDAAGNWELFSDNSGGQGYVSEGSPVQDATHTSAAYAGVVCSFTSSRSSLFFFDNFYIGAYEDDTNGPELVEVNPTLPQQIDIRFNEAVSSQTALSPENYQISSIGQPASIQAKSDELYTLFLSSAMEEGTNYQLKVSGIVDLFGNPSDTLFADFTYINDLDTVIRLSDRILSVRYKRAPSATALEKTNYRLNGSLTAASVSATNGAPLQYQVVFDTPFDNGNNVLQISGIEDGNGVEFKIPPFTFLYDNAAPEVRRVRALAAKEIRVYFSEPLAEVSAQNYSNFLVNNGIGNPYQALYQAEDTSLLLRFQRSMSNETTYRLSTQGLTDLQGNSSTRTINTTFRYDTRPPYIQSVRIAGDSSLWIRFSEALSLSSAQNTDNFLINGPGNPIEALRKPEDSLTVALQFGIPLPTAPSLTLFVRDIEDNAGNSLSIPIEWILNTQAPQIFQLEVVSDTELWLHFSQAMDNSALNTNVYTLSDGQKPLLVGPIGNLGKSVSLNFEQPFSTFTEYQLSTSGLRNSLSIGLQEPQTETFTYQTYLEQITILSPNVVEVIWDDNLRLRPISEETGFTISPSIGQPNAVSWSADSNSVQLVYANPLSIGNSYTLQVPTQRNQFGQLIPAGNHPFSYDKVAPSISTLTQTFAQQVDLVFSEPMLARTVQTATFYTINTPEGFPTEIIFSASNPTQVSLTFSGLISGQSYTLKITGLQDLAGNTMADFTTDFVYQEPAIPSFGDILITEIMSVPLEGSPLPNTEYLEIYNAGSTSFFLKDLILSDASNSTSLPAGVLEPDSYLILCPNSSVALFEEGKAIGVSSWPSLNNSGDEISLFTADGLLIHQVNYSETWYNDILKQDAGGWALEMVDLSNPCAGAENWTASEAEQQGTPGAANSVQNTNPDSQGPQLLSAYAFPEKLIVLAFSEAISPVLPSEDFLTFSSPITILGIQVASDQTHLLISYSGNLEASTQVSVNTLSDCSGNRISSETNTQTIQAVFAPASGDVVLNEILFNPRSGGVDFVELYNASTQFMNLQNCYLGNHTPDNQKIISASPLILAPQQYLVISTSTQTLKSDYPSTQEENAWQVSSLPSYPDTEGGVSFLNETLDTLDIFHYTDDLHLSFLTNKEGVSLERISPTVATQAEGNWRSAAKGQSSAGYATPGFLNSQSGGIAGSNSKVQVNPQVFTPDNDGVNDYTLISYSLSGNENISTLAIYDAQGRKIKTLLENEYVSGSGFIRWDGDTDQGTVARTGYYLIVMEKFTSEGQKEVLKEKIVVGNMFR
ncbi:Ig-like domain-containing protein [Cytophagales bacterium LB-30]|uniref:Ig-like domain-containing protein n=1 Tax=Shiella aurantiaca TaxID=3058365 RepID=A0ABT8F788_9BACT|nr:Ig-like domain-containing protein [Shiella aurantiaca]MDN4166104.1 Ig-like domain-containing protein [Shiella aurantiaca]